MATPESNHADTAPSPKPGSGCCYLCCRQFAGHRYLTSHTPNCLQKLSWRDHLQQPAAAYAHVSVIGSTYHWMELAIAEPVTLRQLDQFLRQTWLECCQHLSQFTFGPLNVADPDTAGDWTNSVNHVDLSHIVNMETRYLAAVLPGMTAGYEYDFGTTSALTLATRTVYPLPLSQSIVVLARNQAYDPDVANSPRAYYPCFDATLLVEPPTAPRL